MWLNEFSNNVRDRLDGKFYESFPVHPQFPVEGYRNYTIRIDQQYRADKIAYELYDRVELTWVLDIANNFKHGFKEYKEGRTIRVPTREALRRMNIL